MRNALVVYGDIGVDIHVRTTYRPQIGQDAKVEGMVFSPGGSAANCAAVASRLGIPTIFLGFTGKDHFGKLVRSDLRRSGISTRSLQSIDADTGITIAINEPAGERTFYSYRGANSSGVLSEAPSKAFEKSRYLHLSGYSFENEHSARNAIMLTSTAKREGVSISLDPSYWYSREFHKHHPSLLSDIDIIFPNREEARLISGSNDPGEASRILLAMGPKLVVIKLGPEGCYIASQQEQGYIAAVTMSGVVDTTGAGDAFCGGFLFGQTMGLDLKASATIGNIASSLVIGQVGGHVGAPTIDRLIDILSNTNEVSLARELLDLRKTTIASQA